MQTNVTLHNTTLQILIDGHVSGISEVMELQNIMKQHTEVNFIELIFPDAFVIPSALIGYLLRVIKVDKKTVQIKAQRQELRDLINDLNLSSVLNIS